MHVCMYVYIYIYIYIYVCIYIYVYTHITLREFPIIETYVMMGSNKTDKS